AINTEAISNLIKVDNAGSNDTTGGTTGDGTTGGDTTGGDTTGSGTTGSDTTGGSGAGDGTTGGDTTGGGTTGGDTTGSGTTGSDTTGGSTGNTNSNGSGESSSKNTTYKISGVAWLDANKDGKRDDSEQLLSGITVKLMQNGKYLKDAKTDDKGSYSFDGLANGAYVVEFEIDNTKYDVTVYQAQGVIATLNSDAKLVTTNGATSAQTTSQTVNGADLSNIDIGLALKPKFDLSLNKYISKVTVQNADGTAQYQYDKDTGKFAKVDIRAQNLKGTVVIVEYTIAVSNNGEVAGMAKYIVDYMSPDFKFNSELNPKWYVGQDGSLYSTELANTAIKPGETKEIKLVLTKTMTENNTGTTANTSEIYKDYNDYAIKDINSTPGNKAASENDFSEADVLITLRTGSPAMYISIVIGCMLVLRWRNILHQ
ncbi:MAG: hypothetical protein FWC53_01210, partial [Firmicutes bacterium]|nr:hypothetical protein [Bacillota bacterium]